MPGRKHRPEPGDLTFDPIDLGSIRRLGILVPNWLGDAVMAEPTIRAIADAAPHLEIKTFGKPGTLAMLDGKIERPS